MTFSPAPKPAARVRAPKEKPKRKPIKPKKRSKSEFARIYGSKARVAFVKSLPCVVNNLGLCSVWERENAHIEGEGIGRKAGFDRIVPLCFGHHRELHLMGLAPFEIWYSVDLQQAAAETEKLWQSQSPLTGKP